MRCWFLLLGVASSLFSLPQGIKIVQGEIDVRETSNRLQIHATDSSILNWKDFSIAPSECVQFIQPSSTSRVLNRVQGECPSHIMGQLCANGQIYLINPNGVIFGRDSNVLVSGLFVSTLDCPDQDVFLNQDFLFQGDSKEAIINYGTLRAIDGDIVLLGRVVENYGTLSAPDGEVSITAGQEILLRPTSTSILTIRPKPNKDGRITHCGTIEALRVSLQSEGQAYSYGINIEGVVSALNPVEEGGKIYLKSDGVSLSPTANLQAPLGSIEIVSVEKGIYNEGTIAAEGGCLTISQESFGSPSFQLGTLDVSGSEGGRISLDVANWMNHGKILAQGRTGDGGSIAIRSNGSYVETVQGFLSADGLREGGDIFVHSDISLFSSGQFSCKGDKGGEISLTSPIMNFVGSDIDVSGIAGGGVIHIGAASDVKTIYFGGDAHLSASAMEIGDGGQIILLSEEKTTCYGSIEAKGGVCGGNGGKIEVSSKGDLNCYATCNLSSPLGKAGSFLLDPKNIIVEEVNGIYPQYQLLDPNPASGTGFGLIVLPLSNGNIVVTKPQDSFGAASAGAVFLYNGKTGNLLSSFYGSTASDQIGNGNVTVLSNGNYVVRSPNWDNGFANDAGAVTWCSGTTGVSGQVSSLNSLVGSTTNDQIGIGGITVLSNGNYVVRSSGWDNGIAVNAGAVTWGSGTAGILGPVTSSNSLVGSNTNDQIGSGGITVLPNGNYVVRSPGWSGGATNGLGAVTWGSGAAGVSGVVSSSNSLVGSTATNLVGGGGITVLSNGNYVVASPDWDNGPASNAGAVTWGSGTAGVSGAVSSSNSLVGSQASDQVGGGGITVLSNGNYVVRSPNWDNGSSGNAGAVTWGNGTTGTTGTVSTSNSLVGSLLNDQVGGGVGGGVTALSNGNYVVRSPNWDNGVLTNVGAVTWGDGTTGTTGPVSTSNSIVGSTANDQVGGGIIAVLSNGNYVFLSPNWDDGVVSNVGAVTWRDGTMASPTGTVSSSNSLVGSTANDLSGAQIVALSNGNYVVRSPNWDNGGAVNAGAVTFGNGTTGVSGVIDSTNSLVGSTTNDQIGGGGGGIVTALANGNYVVRSPSWNNGAATLAGAVTWGSGTTGVSGIVSALNSFIGSSANDQIGSGGFADLLNGNYVFLSPNWDDGVLTNVGAATWGDGTIKGPLATSNSLCGSLSGDQVGSGGISVLANGNYVIRSPNWANGPAATAGAVTWGDGTTGVSGQVSSSNSLVGSSSSDQIGGGPNAGIIVLPNGNYVVRSPNWDNVLLGAVNAGAATWCNGTTGDPKGPVSISNSLVGSLTGDLVGGGANGTNIVLSNGNYLVTSPSWHTGSLNGALTWGNANGGPSNGGIVRTQNSIVGPSGSPALQASQVISDTVNETFIARYFNSSLVSYVFVGLQNPAEVQFATDQANTMTIAPSFINYLLDGGSPVILQANNDFTLSGDILSTGSGELSISTGRSCLMNAMIDLNQTVSIVANDSATSGVVDAYRDPGTAVLNIDYSITSNGLNLSLLDGMGNLNNESGDITIGAALECSGSGSMTILAQEHNVNLTSTGSLKTDTGDITITAGDSFNLADNVDISPTGVGGQLILNVGNISY